MLIGLYDPKVQQLSRIAELLIHSVEITEIYFHTFVSQKFRESNVFTTEVTKELISRNSFFSYPFFLLE